MAQEMIERVELSDDKSEVVITFSYATEIGIIRLSVNDDGITLGVNETLQLTDLSHEPPVPDVGDDLEHGYTRVELLAVSPIAPLETTRP
jgi:hypothetical protein